MIPTNLLTSSLKIYAGSRQATGHGSEFTVNNHGIMIALAIVIATIIGWLLALAVP